MGADWEPTSQQLTGPTTRPRRVAGSHSRVSMRRTGLAPTRPRRLPSQAEDEAMWATVVLGEPVVKAYIYASAESGICLYAGRNEHAVASLVANGRRPVSAKVVRSAGVDATRDAGHLRSVTGLVSVSQEPNVR
jgi:hypothetical protein